MITITATESQISMHGDELKLYPHTSPVAVLWSRRIQEAECKYVVHGEYVSDKNVTAFIKGWVVALLCAWQSWQWVTLFRRGFALSSIISHYYMSHLLPRIPMGDYKYTHTHTLTYEPTCSHIQIIPCMPSKHHPQKSQRHTLAPGQKSSISQQPSPTSTTRQLVKRKNHLNDTDEPAQHTAEQKSFGAWGNTCHPLCDITKRWEWTEKVQREEP